MIKLLVLVIANIDPLYEVHWIAWRRAMVDRHPSVDVYFVVADPFQAQPAIMNKAANCISVKTTEQFVPGILFKTVEAINWMLKQDGGAYTHVLRTNLSSLWRWSTVVERVTCLPSGKPLVAGVRLMDDTMGPFVSGAGILLNRQAALLLVQFRSHLDTSLLDDVAIGRLLCSDLGVPVVDVWKRYDFVGQCLPDTNVVAAAALDPRHYHWRVKGQVPPRAVHDAWVLGLLVHYLQQSC